MNEHQHIYGPVSSRRLGRSLGIDLVPFKTCTYDCIYCQLGRTTNRTIERKEYVPVDTVVAELKRQLLSCPQPDYISLAGSGEPTLNSRIGELIAQIKNLTNIPVAVLTNGSLLWMKKVQEALMPADLVLPSLDAGDENIFRHVNRPHVNISFERMIEGIVSFTKKFPKEVWLEVFLLGGITGIAAEVEKIAALVQHIAPARVQLNTVSRPPTEEFASAVSHEQMKQFCALIPGIVEIISETQISEPTAWSANKTNPTELVALLSRRPCTVEGIALGLGLKPNEVIKLIDDMVKSGVVVMKRGGEKVFYSIARKQGDS